MTSRNQRRRSQQKRPQHVIANSPVEITESKVNPAYAGLSLFYYGTGGDVPQPHMMPKNYKNYAQEGYRGNDTIFKCINYIITNGAAIPPKLYTDDTKQTEIKSHPLLDKLKRPNPEKSGVQFRKAVLGYYLVAGNSYIYAIRKGITGPPDELWPMQPDKIKINPTATRGVVSYLYDDFQGSLQDPKPGQNPIPAANMLHLMTWAPDDPLFGVSPIEVGAIKVDQQTAAQKWNLALLQNWARMPGIVTTPIILEPNVRSKTEDKVNEKMSGSRNAGRIPVLDGGLSWTQIGAPPADMDWLQAIQYNAGSLANLYNMPPQLIGDTSSTTYDNMEQAKAASYTEEIFPILDEMYAELTMWLVPMYPDLPQTACIYYDKDSVEVVQAVIQQQKTAKAQRANTAWMQGSMMLDEARELQGLPPLPKGMGQVFRFGAVIVRASELDDYADQSLKTPAAPPAPVPENILDVPAPAPGTPSQPKPGNENNGDNDDSDQPPPDADDNGNNNLGKSHPVSAFLSRRFGTKALDLQTKEEKQAYFEQVEAARHKWEDTISGRLQDYFKSEQKAVVSAIRHSTSTATDKDHLLNQAKAAIASHKSKLQSVIATAWQDVAGDFAKQTEAQFQNAKAAPAHQFKGVEFFSTQTIKYLLSLAGQKVTGINQTTLDMLQIALANGVEGGESLIQLAKRIDQLYLDEIIPNRSQVIAATEIVGASNYGSMQYAKQSGLTLNKTWQATGDGHTRPAHAEADGQTVAMDTPFEVGGDQLDYPGDPSGSAANVINCRCSLFYQRVASAAPDESSSDDNSDDEEDEKRRRRLEYKRFMEVLV